VIVVMGNLDFFAGRPRNLSIQVTSVTTVLHTTCSDVNSRGYLAVNLLRRICVAAVR